MEYLRLDEWAAVWTQYGADQAGWPDYQHLLDAVKRDLLALGAPALKLRNHLPLIQVLDHIILAMAMGGTETKVASELRAERLAS